MPFFSVLIPVYNDEEYLAGCLNSVLRQDYLDWEAIVVIDGCSDRSREIADGFASRDGRFKVVAKEGNQGTHRARMSAVAACAGRYALFLDADDELVEGALGALHQAVDECPAEMLHFGVEVVDINVGADERAAFEAGVNSDTGDLRGRELIDAAYSERMGYGLDWRVTERLYDSGTLKCAFRAMTQDRLGRAQDGYEFFVIASCFHEQVTRNDIVGYRYFYGRGVSGAATLGIEGYAKTARDFWSTIRAIEDYAATFERFDLSSPSRGAKVKLLQLLVNDWHVRVPSDKKIEAARQLERVVGSAWAATEIMRIARDEAYGLLCNGDASADGSEVASWIAEAERMRANASDVPFSYLANCCAAKSHLKDIRRRNKLACHSDDAIRIFVSSHKDVDLFDSKILQPVQVGSELASWRFPYMLHDDEGENISEMNALYCELTTQYWAWKNVDAEYYGFCHYRRYFDFSEKRHAENAWGEIVADRIDVDAQKEYCLDDESMRRAIEGYDVITSEVKDLRKFPGTIDTPRKQYNAAESLHSDDLKHVFEIVLDMHPDYEMDARKFLDGNYACFCNMFIMRKEIFRDYCSWLFPILERFVSETNFVGYSREALRTPGHLAERLLNVYCMHAERTRDGWKSKQLQCVHFKCPEPYYNLAPAFESDGGFRAIIPVAFAADDAYVPMLTTTIHSMLKNASPDYRYDVIVLERDISASHEREIKDFFSTYGNVAIRFCNVASIVDAYELTTSNAHISVETYYRFLVQELMPFYDKVLYLDSDLIVKGDISELYELELGDNLLAAAHDMDFMGNLNMKDGKRMDYAKRKLGLKDPYAYFQAGVLVLNTQAMRALHPVRRWLEYASDPSYIYNDQDVLNAHCKGRVLYLDYEWNVMIDCNGRIESVFAKAPADAYKAFLRSRSREKIVHYAGFEKPWSMASCDRATLYWQYARETPYYEVLLAKLIKSGDGMGMRTAGRIVSEASRIRGAIDPILPVGSRRRELVKSIARRLRR